MKLGKKASGVLLHITSLPSDFGIGDLGPWSRRFVEVLSRIKQRYWSILPLTPTSSTYGNSPYQTSSSFAGNTLLISPESLARDGLLPKEYIYACLTLPPGRVDYKAVSATKNAMLKKAYENFRRNCGARISAHDNDFEAFCSENSKWLDDYALYKALREKSGRPWCLWPRPLRNREAQAVAKKMRDMEEPIEQEKFAQFAFFRQWRSLKEHCKRKKVSIIGDLGFYVGYDSADVWTYPEIFKLNAQKRPKFVGGVPPDYFSRNGQVWGNPVYDWRQLEKTRFVWWMDRIRHNLRLFDILRLDHFRGFIAYWQIPAAAKTAKKGSWVRVPSKDFFRTLKGFLPNLPFIAEDLGLITDTVKKTIRLLGFPGMRVLLFAFEGKQSNPHLPSNHEKNSVVFTGTHDTNTVRGWFVDEATAEERRRVFKCIGRRVSEEEISREFIRLALASRANLSIVPMQDALSLGSEARMNHPGRLLNNWEWRIAPGQMSSKGLERLGEMTESFERDNAHG